MHKLQYNTEANFIAQAHVMNKHKSVELILWEKIKQIVYPRERVS